MFPVFEEEETALMETEQESPMPWTYKFDWSTYQLKKGLDGRYMKTETYAEYLEETAKKILNTKRFQYAIYTENYGVDYFDNIGHLPKNVQLLLIKNEAEEALEAHNEIEKADVQDIQFRNKGIWFSIEIEGVRGKTKVEVTTWTR